ncbi:ESX secretion-associated protein EspG [Saccharopolyspora sp. MS10]|uniref:ESX secretion-associated protein EspG n=1 Tax=Saccharopolyspora sp. MS10 TaxID=3385973 RepID=UPI0039A2FF74
MIGGAALPGAGPVRLSALEFDVLAEHLGLETLPLVLRVPSPGRTWSERAELADSAWAALDRRRLGDRHDLDPALERMLLLLARPLSEVDGRTWFERSVRVLAASGVPDGSGADAVLVVKDEDQLTLRPVSAAGLVREATSVLPPLSAGPGRSVTVPSADLDAAADATGGDPEALEGELVRRGVRGDDAEVLTSMVREAGARGQFGAAVRDRLGRRVRAPRVVGFFDTPRGRYAQVRRNSPSGDSWSTISPADSRRLVAHVEELLGDVP